jgi:hypothetical protein
MHKLTKARKEYVCYECGKPINKGDLYSKQGRGSAVNQSVGWKENRIVNIKENICEECTEDDRFTHYFVKDNPERYKGCVKFGDKYFGKKWSEVDDATLEWYANNLNNKHFKKEAYDEQQRRQKSL